MLTTALRAHQTMIKLHKIGRTGQIDAACASSRAKLAETETNLAELAEHHLSNLAAIKVLPEDTSVIQKDVACLASIGVIQHGSLHLLGETIRETVARLTAALAELQCFYDVDRFVVTATNLVDAMRSSAAAAVVAARRVHPYASVDFDAYFSVVQLLYKRITEMSGKLRELETVYAEGKTLWEKCPETKDDGEEDEEIQRAIA